MQRSLISAAILTTLTVFAGVTAAQPAASATAAGQPAGKQDQAATKAARPARAAAAAEQPATTQLPRNVRPTHYAISLVPDAQAAAKDWFAREGVVPINHMFVIHEDLSKQRPDIVRELYRMIAESRALTAGGVPAIFPPIGLEANRKGLQLAIDWALDQKIIPHRISVDECFDEVTASLG